MSESVPRDLAVRLARATAGPLTTEAAVLALAAAAPLEALDWLLAAPPAGVVPGKVIDAVVAAILARPEPPPAALVDLLQRHHQTAAPESARALVAALPAERRDAPIRALLDAYLQRAPHDAALLRAAADLAVAAGDGTAADVLLTRLARADDSQATVRHAWRARASLVLPGRTPVRVALLSSYTIDPLVPYLDLECRALGLDPRISIAPFNSWAQEIIAPDSTLRRFEPEIAFLAVSIDDLIPDLAGAPDAATLEAAGTAAVDRVLAVARTFTQWSSGVLVVHGFHSAYRDPAGPLAGRGGPSRASWLARLNARLEAGLAELPAAYLLDVADVLQRRGGGAMENPKMRHMAGMRLGEQVLGEIARAAARFIAPLKGLARKCVVVDLDNTLWGGVVGEDGPHGIKLGNTSPGSEYQELQRYLLSLTDRGFLLAINSKNNPDDALEVLRGHEGMILRETAFSAVRINWRPKPENMASLAEELSIGLDAMVFLDDNPDERELMRQLLPQVLTPELPADPARYRGVVEALPQLQSLVVTTEDRTRVAQYRSKRERDALKETTGSLDGYLHSLDIVAEIAPAGDATLARVHQLFQRTNQFNLTTRRYEAGQLAAFARDPGWHLYVMRARDRFGDHGLVATALVRSAPDTWTVDSFLMSCRVIGYGLETTLLARVCGDARAAGATALVGEFIPTKKNVPAQDFYPRHGFVPGAAGDAGGVTTYRRDLGDGGVARPAWVQEMALHDA